MHSFTDTSGRTWNIEINVDAIRRVRSHLKVNLLEAIEGRLLEQLISDPVLLCDVLFVLVEPEATAKSVSDEDFGRSLGGDVLDQATTALLEELVDFFPSGRRAVFRKALEKLKTLEQLALATATERLESDELEQQMLESLKTVDGRLKERIPIQNLQSTASGLQPMHGSSSGNSPASPKWIPLP